VKKNVRVLDFMMFCRATILASEPGFQAFPSSYLSRSFLAELLQFISSATDRASPFSCARIRTFPINPNIPFMLIAWYVPSPLESRLSGLHQCL